MKKSFPLLSTSVNWILPVNPGRPVNKDVDCPWREQALYVNDGRNQALAGYYACGEGVFPATSFELLGKGLKSDHWLGMCMPAAIDITIPSFTLVWFLAVCDHWLYRGDLVFIKHVMPVVRSILTAREREIQNGLLPCPTGARYWHFYDWVDGLDGVKRLQSDEVRWDAHLNIGFCLALMSGATLAYSRRLCGDGDVSCSMPLYPGRKSPGSSQADQRIKGDVFDMALPGRFHQQIVAKAKDPVRWKSVCRDAENDSADYYERNRE